MGRKINLSHLTEEECEQILKVIQKDFDIRQVEKERLASIEAKVQEEDARMKILATRQDFNEKYCLICFKKFLLFFTPKTRCAFCKHYLCKNCISFDVQLKAEICLVCKKYHEFLQQSNSWFYKKIGNKFKRFGSAKVVRSLYKRKTDSDAESDSGYHPSVRENVCLSESMARRSRPNLSKVFEIDEIKENEATEEDKPVQTLSHYRHKLEAIARQIRKQFIEAKGDRHIDRSSGSYDELMKQQAFNISLLLSAMTNELTSQLNESAVSNDQSKFHENELGETAAKEAISKCVLEQCISHIYESSVPANADDDDRPFGIDPDDLTLRSYIEQLSAAIVTKINVELQSSEEKIFREEEDEVRKQLLRLSNRARISQIGKHLSDSELEDLQVTTDSMSDVDGREWQTRSQTDTLSANSSLRRPVNQTEFDEREYDVDENSIFAFASRKKGLVTLPGLDNSSPAKLADIDLELTAHNDSLSEDPWTLAERGPVAMMTNRIPIAPYDNYGKKKCGPAEAEGDLKIFLPKRHSIEGPMIDSMNVYELSDLSDGSCGSTFEEAHADHEVSVTKQLPLSQSKRPRSSVEYVEVSADRAPEEDLEVPADRIPLKHLELPAHGTTVKHAESDCDERSSEPKFVTFPEDVVVSCGEAFTCSCRLSGAKPIDIFWYRDADELIQLGSDERFTMSHKGSIHEIYLSNCQLFDAGLYLCIAVNQHGSCQHRFCVRVQDEKICKNSLLDSSAAGEVSYENSTYQLGLAPSKTDGLKSGETNRSKKLFKDHKNFEEDGLAPSKTNGSKSGETNSSERLLKDHSNFEEDGEGESKNLMNDATSSANWKNKLTTGIQSNHQESKQPWNNNEHPMGSQDLANRSAEQLPNFDMESSEDSSATYEDKVTASGMISDLSGRVNGNKAIGAISVTENEKEATAMDKETNEFLSLQISPKKSLEDEIRSSFTSSDDKTTADDSTELLRINNPNEADIRTTSKDSQLDGVRIRSMADIDRHKNSSSYRDHQKSDEDNGTTVVSDGVTDNDNRMAIKENEEHQLSHGGSKRSNVDDITSSAVNETEDGDDTIQVEDSITEHHLSYRYYDNKPKIRSFYERFADGSTTQIDQSGPIRDEISQHPIYKDGRISVETETRRDSKLVNKSRACEETTETKVHPMSGGFQEISGEYEKLSSARPIPSQLTSADSKIKETVGNFKNNQNEKNSYTDTRTITEVQIPQNVDYRQYSRDYDISGRRALFEQNDKLAITERRISASPSHLARRSRSSSSESEVFTPQTSSEFVGITSVNLSSVPQEAQLSKKSDLDEISLPSVKLLRLKFSTPPDTSSAITSLQRKRHSQTKLESETRWKSAEQAEKQVTYPSVPVSVIPLQPEPINSRYSSRPASRTDNADISSPLKSEPKFQREVIIRPHAFKYSQTDSEERQQPEPDDYLLPQSDSVAERVVIRPFHERGNRSTIIESKKQGSSYQNR